MLGEPVARAFAGLSAAGVPYVVLRGFDPIEELSTSIDIDVFVPANTFDQAASILQQTGWTRRAAQTGRHPHCFFDSWDAATGVVRSIDVVTELCYGEELRLVARGDDMVSRGLTEDGVRRPAPWDALVTLVLHVLLDKRGLSEANHERLARATERANADLLGRPATAATFGAEVMALLDDFIAARSRPGESLSSFTARATRLQSVKARPMLARYTRWRARWRQFTRPVGRVAVLGVDGSGKSTIIETLSSAPSTLRIWNGYLGNNAFRTPPARWLESQLAPFASPDYQGSRIRHRVLANLRTLWWPVELATRMAIAEHRSEVVLYDRFPIGQDDGCPTTLWGRIVQGYARTARALLPRPDLVILLDGDDHVIWERKRESPFEVHQAVQERYRKTVRAHPGEWAFVRTDTSREESIKAVRQAIAESATLRRKLYRC